MRPCAHVLIEPKITAMENEDFDGNAWMMVCLGQARSAAEPAPGYGDPSRPRNPVVDETFELASSVIDYCERLEPRNRLFAEPMLACGTSVGSHTREAQGAESLADFVHKMKIGYKELEETDYRLALCHCKPHYPHEAELVTRTKKLFPLFSSILATSKQRLREQRKRN